MPSLLLLVVSPVEFDCVVCHSRSVCQEQHLLLVMAWQALEQAVEVLTVLWRKNVCVEIAKPGRQVLVWVQIRRSGGIGVVLAESVMSLSMTEHSPS